MAVDILSVITEAKSHHGGAIALAVSPWLYVNHILKMATFAPSPAGCDAVGALYGYPVQVNPHLGRYDIVAVNAEYITTKNKRTCTHCGTPFASAGNCANCGAIVGG